VSVFAVSTVVVCVRDGPSGSRGAICLATASPRASSRVASYGLALGALPDDDRTAEEAGVRRGDDAAENGERLARGLL
jgi:hypothetical protein